MLSTAGKLYTAPSFRQPINSLTTMQSLSCLDHKQQLWQAWQANHRPASKALHKAARRAARQSALADYERQWASDLGQVQNSMRKGDLHTAQQPKAKQAEPYDSMALAGFCTQLKSASLS